MGPTVWRRLLITRGARLAGAWWVAACLGGPALPVQAQGDVFSSSGSPQRPGGGNTTRRTGKQAIQDDSVYCQQTPDGRVIPKPYGGTRRNIPCGLPGVAQARPTPPEPPEPACRCPSQQTTGRESSSVQGTQASRARQAEKQNCDCPTRPVVTPVFNYYYINGINTPKAFDDPNLRGSCMWDRRMIEGNLLDRDGGNARVPKESQDRRGPGYATSIKIGLNEIDVLQRSSCQFSGSDRATEQRVKRLCQSAGNASNPGWTADTFKIAKVLCSYVPAEAIDNVRGGFGKLAPGDLLESLAQSMNTGPTTGTRDGGAAGIEFTAELPLVQEIARLILEVYKAEISRPPNQRTEKNFFIVIGHSQGNFFAEGVAYRLMKMKDSKYPVESGKVFKNRLGIMSFGSPTSYDSLQEPGYLVNRVKHFTRKDDVIRALDSVPRFLGSKAPWPDPQLPPLWSQWPEGELKARLNILAPNWHWDNPLTIGGWVSQLKSPLFEAMALSPPKGTCKPKCPACDEKARCDGALYTPLMNAHMLDNYLTEPTLTDVGIRIHGDAAVLLGLPQPFSPRATPVLRQVRLGLAQLKRNLWRFGGD
ncbi:MAG: hypothetical protein ABI699_00500 [Caldimonas sp.]